MNDKIAIVEDDSEIREWLQGVISSNGRFQCVGTFGKAQELIDSFPDVLPDIVLIDIQLPGMSGVECVSKLKPLYPATQFVMCTVFDDSDKVFNSLTAGATGYILKNITRENLIEALEDISRGGSPMTAHIARKVVDSFHEKKLKKASNALLSTREKEILEWLSKGYRYKEIADKLFISTETVRTHVRNIYEKLQVNSRTEALNKAYIK